ncbi:MAG: hypothetical protein HKL88_08600 [Bacteroidia bacterium]|nr:hypothetical protein [Bacteroidia bacterium]
MNFLFPSFLYALSAVSIPIIIHLFNFRRYKKLYFSNVALLQAAVQESRSRSMLKHWLVLLCRILAVAFLALAFAQPYLPVKHGIQLTGSKAVSIFIDNSFSMNALTPNGSLLDEAKAEAIEMAQELNPSDKVQLVSQDFDETEERWLNKDEFAAEVKGLKTSSDSRTLSDIIKRQHENLNHSGCPVKECFCLSDFQKSFSRISSDLGANGDPTSLVPLEAESRNNISADSCWFDSPLHLPGKPEMLNLRIRNYSGETSHESAVKLFINGEEKAIASCNIAPNSFTVLHLSFIPSGKAVQQGMAAINDYPITFDDKLYFSFSLTTRIPVLRIHPESMGSNDYLHNLYGRDSLFTYNETTGSHVDYASLPSYRLIILDGLTSIESGMGSELKSYVQKGGSLLIIPPAAGLNSDNYRETLGGLNCSWYGKMDTTHVKTDKLNFESPLYRSVFEGRQSENLDLPQTFRHYVITGAGNGAPENLMKLENGDDLLDLFHSGKGSIYLLAVPLNDDFGNFQKHALFVPTLYNMALYSLPVRPLYYTLGDIQPVEAPNITLPQNSFFKIRPAVQTDSKAEAGPGDANTLLPERRIVNNSVFLYLHNQLSSAGNYELLAGDSLLSGCSFNYNRRESDMSFYSATELRHQCDSAGLKNFSVLQVNGKSMPGVLQEVNRGTYLWKYCIILALIFLAAEEAIIRIVT